jgi:hypothetical protein
MLRESLAAAGILKPEVLGEDAFADARYPTGSVRARGGQA